MKNKVEKEIIHLLMKKIALLGLSESDINKQTSLITQGLLDSISFLEFTLELEAQFGLELDFSEADPSEFTSVNSLTKLIEHAN